MRYTERMMTYIMAVCNAEGWSPSILAPGMWSTMNESVELRTVTSQMSNGHTKDSSNEANASQRIAMTAGIATKLVKRK